MKETKPDKETLKKQRRIAEKLGVPEIERHIFLCCDPTKSKCCSRKRSLKAWKHLKQRVKELRLAKAGAHTSRATCLHNCLGRPPPPVNPAGPRCGPSAPPVP